MNLVNSTRSNTYRYVECYDFSRKALFQLKHVLGWVYVASLLAGFSPLASSSDKSPAPMERKGNPLTSVAPT